MNAFQCMLGFHTPLVEAISFHSSQIIQSITCAGSPANNTVKPCDEGNQLLPKGCVSTVTISGGCDTLTEVLTVRDWTPGHQQWFLMTQCEVATWFSFYSEARDDAHGSAEIFRLHVLFTRSLGLSQRELSQSRPLPERASLKHLHQSTFFSKLLWQDWFPPFVFLFIL